MEHFMGRNIEAYTDSSYQSYRMLPFYNISVFLAWNYYDDSSIVQQN